MSPAQTCKPFSLAMVNGHGESQSDRLERHNRCITIFWMDVWTSMTASNQSALESSIELDIVNNVIRNPHIALGSWSSIWNNSKRFITHDFIQLFANQVCPSGCSILLVQCKCMFGIASHLDAKLELLSIHRMHSGLE